MGVVGGCLVSYFSLGVFLTYNFCRFLCSELSLVCSGFFWFFFFFLAWWYWCFNFFLFNSC